MSNPTPPVGMSADYLAGWNARGLADGTMPPPPAPPPVSAPTPLQRWAAKVSVSAGPYLADGLDLAPLIAAAKPGTVFNCTPGGKYTIGSTVTVPSNSSLLFNGATVACTASAGASSNLILSANVTVAGGHVTRGSVLFRVTGRGCKIAQMFTDDYAGSGAAGLSTHFTDAEMVDITTADNLTISGCWMGVTGSQQVYATCNHSLMDCYLAGSLTEYNYRTEIVGTVASARPQKVTVTNCTFRYLPANGKGSSIGLRMCGPVTAAPNSIVFTNCYIEGNARLGQTPPGTPVPTDPKANANGVVFTGCTFVGYGTRETITSMDGVTASVQGCTFYTDMASICIALSTNGNATTIGGSVVHHPVGSPWYRLTNQTANPGTGTVVNMDPYVIPAAPAPF